MIDYVIKRIDGRLEIVNDNTVTIIDQALMGYLNHLANQSLRKIDTILKLTRKRIGCSQKVPIYIHSKLLLMQYYPLRAKTSLLINYFAIAQIIYDKEDNFTIYFKSGASLKMEDQLRIIKQIKMVKKIIDSLDSNVLK